MDRISLIIESNHVFLHNQDASMRNTVVLCSESNMSMVGISHVAVQSLGSWLMHIS